MKIEARNARATDTCVEGGVDVTVVLTRDDGERVVGTVTLIGGARWGNLDMWMSRILRRELDRLPTRHDEIRVMNEIEARAAEAAT